MSVYVDELHNYGWRLGPSCHLIADTQAELHVFAARIGMKPEWFQATSHPHYDLTANRRKHAVELGAVVLERLPFVKKLYEIRRANREEGQR